MNPYFNLILFVLIIVFGVGFEMVLSRIYFKHQGVARKHQVVHFKFLRYLFLISIPILLTLFMAYTVGASVLKYFLLFAAIGTIFEYCIGYSYETIVGQRLWTYYKYSIRGYTSLLSIPLWGLCGVLMYLLVQAIK